MAKVPKKKSEKEISMIIADYVECGSYSEVARRFGVSPNTVKSYVKSEDCKELQEIASKKKEQDARDIESYMNSKKGKVIEIVDKYLDALLDENKINAASPNQLTTAMGTVLDKFMGIKTNDEVNLNLRMSLKDKKAALDEMLEELAEK